MRPFVLSKALARLFSFSRYSPLRFEVVETTNKFKSFWPPIFQEGQPQLFYGRLLSRFIIHRLTKFGFVQFADLRLRSLEMNWNAEFTVGW